MGSSASPLNHMTRLTVLVGVEVVLQGRETLRPMLPSTSTLSENIYSQLMQNLEIESCRSTNFRFGWCLPYKVEVITELHLLSSDDSDQHLMYWLHFSNAALWNRGERGLIQEHGDSFDFTFNDTLHIVYK